MARHNLSILLENEKEIRDLKRGITMRIYEENRIE